MIRNIKGSLAIIHPSGDFTAIQLVIVEIFHSKSHK